MITVVMPPFLPRAPYGTADMPMGALPRRLGVRTCLWRISGQAATGN